MPRPKLTPADRTHKAKRSAALVKALRAGMDDKTRNQLGYEVWRSRLSPTDLGKALVEALAEK